MNELINIGKTVSTFGIKGELKVISNFEYLDNAFKIGNKILLNNLEHTITRVRYHKKWVLLEIDHLQDINMILDYVGFNIYLKRRDLNLKDDEFLYQDLLNCEIINNGEYLGFVVDVVSGGNLLLKVKGDKTYYIPYVSEYIMKFNNEEKKIYTRNVEKLII